VNRINTSRVLVGGLVAGLVINIAESFFYGYLIIDTMNAQMARLNLPPVAGSAIALFIVMGFALGIGTIWVYAAIRPRFGPGMKTARYAGGIVWLLAYFYPTVGGTAMGFMTTQFMLICLMWGLAEIMVAAAIGARFYNE
jgi:hypothetical protein